MNRKKIQRLWREEGLRVPQRKRKRRRLGESTVPAKRLRAERPNHVWALDFQFDTTTDGRTVKLLHIVDEHTREALAIRVARSIDADHAVRVLDQVARERGTRPELVRMDNGPEMTANALRDWCREGGSGRSFIGSPAYPGRTRLLVIRHLRPRRSPLRRSVRLRSKREPGLCYLRRGTTTKSDPSSLGWTAPAVYAASLQNQPGKTTARLS